MHFNKIPIPTSIITVGLELLGPLYINNCNMHFGKIPIPTIESILLCPLYINNFNMHFDKIPIPTSINTVSVGLDPVLILSSRCQKIKDAFPQDSNPIVVILLGIGIALNFNACFICLFI